MKGCVTAQHKALEVLKKHNINAKRISSHDSHTFIAGENQITIFANGNGVAVHFTVWTADEYTDAMRRACRDLKQWAQD